MDLAALVGAVEILMSPVEWASRDAWLAESLRRVRQVCGAAGPGIPADSVSELEALLKNNEAVVIDVRSQAAYDQGHIPGSKLIPSGEILNHISELPRDKMIVTYCS